MSEAIGILFGNNRSEGLKELAIPRPAAAIPFGRYRLLDFALSSMVNSGIRTIGLISPQDNKTMLAHLGAGKSWFLERKAGGLFILPEAIYGLMDHRGQFNLRDIAINVEFLKRDVIDNVVISNCNQVFNINYREALEFHESNQADITLIYKQLDSPPQNKKYLGLVMDDHQLVIDLQDPTKLGNINPYFINMLIIKRKLLLDFVYEFHALQKIDLLEAIVEKRKNLKIFGFLFEGYVGMINSVQDYFKTNMDILDTDVRGKLLLGLYRIHTKVLDHPPTRHGNQAEVKNSLIASGCLIEGNVENSVISRGVIVEPGAHIKNCIFMSRCRIGAQAVLEHVILDKFVEVHNGSILQGSSQNPMVVPKKAKVYMEKE